MSGDREGLVFKDQVWEVGKQVEGRRKGGRMEEVSPWAHFFLPLCVNLH